MSTWAPPVRKSAARAGARKRPAAGGSRAPTAGRPICAARPIPSTIPGSCPSPRASSLTFRDDIGSPANDGKPSAFVRSQGFLEAGTLAECRPSALAAAAASRELQSWRDGRPAPMQCPGSSGISPFYRATHARHLLGGALSRSCYLDHCIEQVTPRSRSALAMAHLINPAAILQLEVGIEAEEIGRTDRVIAPCHFLAPVDDIGKRQLL